MTPLEHSLFLPPFLRRLADPSVKTVMLCGCGGGFDFVHSLLLYPELKRLGKSVVIGSYSFGNPHRLSILSRLPGAHFSQPGFSLGSLRNDRIGHRGLVRAG